MYIKKKNYFQYFASVAASKVFDVEVLLSFHKVTVILLKIHKSNKVHPLSIIKLP